MRTKALLLSAALVAAGVASSMAQSNVYSLNIVGYVNITVTPGYNLISLPLQNADPTSSINSVLTNTYYQGSYLPVPGACAVYTWNPTTSRFNQAEYAGGDGNWYDQSGTVLQTNGLPPGQGFFFQMLTPAQQQASGDSAPFATNLTITLVGSVLTGTNSIAVTSGYNFYGNFIPETNNICSNGFPVVDNSALYTWSGTTYNQALYGLGTNDSDPSLDGNPYPYPCFTDQTGSYVVPVTPAVGSAFLYDYLGPTTLWTQNFEVAP